jgi:hypothetical protein
MGVRSGLKGIAVVRLVAPFGPTPTYKSQKPEKLLKKLKMHQLAIE